MSLENLSLKKVRDAIFLQDMDNVLLLHDAFDCKLKLFVLRDASLTIGRVACTAICEAAAQRSE
jgi:hypothetical protein